jgi:hypothetical protein
MKSILTSILCYLFGERQEGDSSVQGQSVKRVLIYHTEHPNMKDFNTWVRYHRIYNGLWRKQVI